MNETAQIHILYVITKLELGGAQKVGISLFNGVMQRGYSASLIAGKGGILDSEVSHHDSVYLLPVLHRECSWRTVLNEIRTFYTLIVHIRNLRKQYPHLIVHTHSTKAGLLGRWAAFFARAPIRVHTIHGFAFHAHQNWLKWLFFFSVEWFTSFITTHFVMVSSYDVALIHSFFPFFQRKYTVIRAAIAWDRFQAARSLLPPRKAKPFVFGTVVCFKPQKNIFDLLYAFHAAYQRSSDIRCEIIGDGEQREAIEAWIREHKLSNVITLHGWQKDVPSIMARWHAFILTSLWEGLPCAVVEARVLQLPVLSYATGGIGDVITSQLNGMLYPQKKWQLLAEDMHRLAHDVAWYNLLSTHRDQLDAFKDQVMIDAHCDLYARLSM